MVAPGHSSEAQPNRHICPVAWGHSGSVPGLLQRQESLDQKDTWFWANFPSERPRTPLAQKVHMLQPHSPMGAVVRLLDSRRARVSSRCSHSFWFSSFPGCCRISPATACETTASVSKLSSNKLSLLLCYSYWQNTDLRPKMAGRLTLKENISRITENLLKVPSTNHP